MKRKLWVWSGMVLAGSAMFLAGCGLCGEKGQCPFSSHNQQKQTPPLSGTQWELEKDSLKQGENAAKLANAAKPENEITLKIVDGKAGGCAGINTYFGSAVTLGENGAITFGPAASTMMAGPGLEYEQIYLQLLPQADTYEIVGDQLLLKKQGQTIMVFEAED